jgi:hypothetical protein
VTFDCFTFFSVSLYTTLYVAMTASISGLYFMQLCMKWPVQPFLQSTGIQLTPLHNGVISIFILWFTEGYQLFKILFS